MVDKTKRALAILQQRQQGQQQQQHHQQQQQQQQQQHHSQIPNPSSDFLSPSGSDQGSRRQTQQGMNDILAATIRNTEERVIEVRRRAEEAVQEVIRLGGLGVKSPPPV